MTTVDILPLTVPCVGDCGRRLPPNGRPPICTRCWPRLGPEPRTRVIDVYCNPWADRRLVMDAVARAFTRREVV